MRNLALKPGDRVEYATTVGGLSGGSCRSVEKVVDRVDEDVDKVHFTDGTTYNHVENRGMTLRKVDGG